MESTIDSPERKTIAETLPASTPLAGTEQLIFTTRVDNGEIVKIETIDANGQRADLTEERCRQLAGDDEISEIDAAIDAAYDAAFADALGTTAEVEGDETDGDPILERLIMFRLLGRRIGRDVGVLRRTLLRRLVLRRLARRHILRNRLKETTQ